MEKHNLGRDFTVSAVGMGCMGLSHAYGAPTEKNVAIRLLHQAHLMRLWIKCLCQQCLEEVRRGL